MNFYEFYEFIKHYEFFKTFNILFSYQMIYLRISNFFQIKIK